MGRAIPNYGDIPTSSLRCQSETCAGLRRGRRGVRDLDRNDPVEQLSGAFALGSRAGPRVATGDELRSGKHVIAEQVVPLGVESVVQRYRHLHGSLVLADEKRGVVTVG